MTVKSKTLPRVEIGPDGKPLFIEALDADFLKTLKPKNPEDVELLYTYKRLYGLETPSDIRKAKIQYLARFNITPDQPGYKNAFRQLAEEVNSNKVVVANARRVSQKMQTVEAAGGDLEKEAVYINDNDDPDGICGNCLSLGGTQEKISWFIANNAQPGDRCLGGGNCLCILVPVD